MGIEVTVPLYIRDDEVDLLAARLQRRAGLKTKTEAVRLALTHELGRIEAARPIEQRIAKSMAMADALGQGGHDLDMKAFMDEMWDEK